MDNAGGMRPCPVGAWVSRWDDSRLRYHIRLARVRVDTRKKSPARLGFFSSLGRSAVNSAPLYYDTAAIGAGVAEALSLVFVRGGHNGKPAFCPCSARHCEFFVLWLIDGARG